MGRRQTSTRGFAIATAGCIGSISGLLQCAVSLANWQDIYVAYQRGELLGHGRKWCGLLLAGVFVGAPQYCLPLSSTRSLPFEFPSLSCLHQLPSHLSSFRQYFTSFVCDFVSTSLVHEADIDLTPPPHQSTHTPGSPYTTLRATHIPLLPVPNVRPPPNSHLHPSIHPSITITTVHPSNLSDAAWQLQS
jgi:hypothetical protein